MVLDICVCLCVCLPSRDCRHVTLVSAVKVMLCILCSLVSILPFQTWPSDVCRVKIEGTRYAGTPEEDLVGLLQSGCDEFWPSREDAQDKDQWFIIVIIKIISVA